MSDDAIRTALERLENKLDRTIDHRHQNGVKVAELNGVVNEHTTYIQDHKRFHDDERKHWRGLNWKIWGAIIVSVIGALIAAVKGNII